MINMTDTTQNIIAPAPATTGAPTPKPAEAKKNGKPKASKKRAGRQRRRGAAHSDSEPEEAADSDGSDSSSEDESEVSEDDDDDDDEEEEAEAEDSDSGAGAGKTIQTGSKAVLADANSVPAVWNTPSSADAEVIQFGGSSSAVVGVETGNGNSNGNAKAKAELRSRKKLSEAQLAKLKEKRERQIAKQKEKRKAAKVAKAEKAAAAKAGAGEGGAEGSEIAGSSSQAKADESKPQPADEVEKDDDTASDGGWGPAAGEASSAGIEIIPGAILPPSPKPTGPTSGKKVKGKKGKQGDNADTDGLVQSTQSMSMRDQEAGPSRQNQARPPRGPRRSQASSEHFDNGQYHQQSGQPGGGGYPAQSHRGGRGGFGPGGMRGGRGGFRGGMNGVPMNGHMGMGMGMGIRGRGRANPFSAFAPRYLPQETGEKDGRLEMDKIEDEERERKERARAAREERERLEAEREERERKEAEKEVKRLAAGGVDDDGWGEVRDDVDPSAVKPTEGNGDDAEDVEAEIDAFLASAAAALEAPVKAGKPVSLAISSATASTVKPSTTAAAPGPVKSGVDGKWGHEAFEHQQQMDLARAANGATGMRGNGRGRGRGRGFGARGGFIPQPQMHGQFNPGRPQQFPPSYPSFGVSSPLAQAGLNGPSHSAEPVPVAATPAAAPFIATTTQAAGATAQTTADDLLDNTPSSTGAVTIHLPGSGPSVQVPLVPLAQTASRDTSAAEPSASGSAAVHPKPLPPHLTGASHISHQSQSSQHSAHSFGSQPVSQGLSRPGSAAAPAFEPASRPLNRAQLALLHSQGIGATPAGEYYRLDSGAPVPTPFVQQLVSQSRNSSASFPRQPIHSTHSSYSHNQNAYAGMPAQSPMFYPDAMAIGADGRPMSPASYNPYADSSAMGTPPLPMHIPLGMQQMQAVQPALPGAGYFVPATSGRKVSIRAPGAEVSESRDTGSAAAKGREMPEEQTSSAQSPGPQQSPSTQSQQASQAYNPYANTYQPMAYDPQMQAQMQAQMQMQHMQMQQMGMGMGLSMGMQAGGYPGQQALDAQLAMGHHQALSGHDQGQGQGQAPYGWYDQSAYYQENYGY